MAQIDGLVFQEGMRMEGRSKGMGDLGRLRLVTGYTLILVSLMGVLGADWDIQWHATVGRDRTFTVPHDMILLGIGLAGIVALVSILIETNWLGREKELQGYGTDFLGRFHSSLGSYLVGFGAVCSAVAFPLDTYWHSLYGSDVTLWAPFHTMIYMGGILSTFGLLYILLSAAHLFGMQDQQRMVNFSYAGVVVMLGILLSKISTFLTPALTGNMVHFLFLTVNIYPLLTAVMVVFVCGLAVRILPWMGAATMVMVVCLLLWLLIRTFVPPMMTLLVQVEHETYLARASQIGSTIVPLIGQTPALLLTALSIDGVVWLGRQKRWKSERQRFWGLVAAIVSLCLVEGLIMIQIGLRLQRTQGSSDGGSVVLFILLSLILVVPGSMVGEWLGRTIGGTMQVLRR